MLLRVLRLILRRIISRLRSISLLLIVIIVGLRLFCSPSYYLSYYYAASSSFSSAYSYSHYPS